MSEREDKGRESGCIVGCLLMFVLLPPLYVLSIGPVALLATRNPSLQWLGVIYFPLGLLAEYFEPVRNALQWYMELWTG